MATCVLVSAMAGAHAQTTPATGTTGKAPARHRAARKPARPSVETQIQQLREDMETQINQLKQQLSDSQSQLQAAQQQAAAANAAAAQAQQQAQQQQQQTTDNTTAVSNLQGAVSDLKTNSSSLASSIQETQTNIEKKVEHPDSIHYKGITISPNGSFIEAATVFRSGATGGDINTAFTSVPLNSSNNAQISEFQGTGRQSRLAIKATGQVASMDHDRLLRNGLAGNGHYLQQQPVQQLCRPPASALGTGSSAQRLEVHRRPDVVPGNGDHEGSRQRHGNPSQRH